MTIFIPLARSKADSFHPLLTSRADFLYMAATELPTEQNEQAKDGAE